ncbi:ribonuclease T2 [Breoghania sp.]|uniref:ribonuclease T2 n=1 Tax=Breoghania sp. TaxID=2065378 RepID=UPI0026247219|nr:ribonuclease T2 [Breoghania sp.]MDJ0932491.1 ribonuclease T2 [Breoghania sp.]
MKTRILAAVAFILLFTPLSASAEIKLDGTFVARQVCLATQNIKAGDNPGDVMTEVDRAYEFFAKNREPAIHYWIGTKGSDPVRCWVAISCGERMVPAGAATGDSSTPDDQSLGDGSDFAQNLLAVSWEPAFCQLNKKKSECVSQTVERYDATHLSLHGRWPQLFGNFHCGVPAEHKALDDGKRYGDLAALELSQETRTVLDRVMPGTQSFLRRHEWTKHGSCLRDSDQEGYFKISLALMETLNAYVVRDLMAAHIGKELTTEAIRKAFDDAFGQGAGARVEVRCDGGMLTELWISLAGDAATETLSDLIHAADAVDGGGCKGGLVDLAGF